jgi:hypothetical protein
VHDDQERRKLLSEAPEHISLSTSPRSLAFTPLNLLPSNRQVDIATAILVTMVVICPLEENGRFWNSGSTLLNLEQPLALPSQGNHYFVEPLATTGAGVSSLS